MTGIVENAYIMAVDPGLSGAVALYSPADGVLTVTDIPVKTGKTGKKIVDADALSEVVDRMAMFADVCVVEAVTAMPKQGVSSAFNFGVGYGLVEGIVTAYGLEVVKVPAAKWKVGAGIARLGPMAKRADRKNASRDRACQVFPTYAPLFARVKDDGRAEAALLAWWYSLAH